NISYDAPIVFDTSGTEQQLSTSYSAALLNGYKSNYGSIDLRSNYKFTWSYDLLSSQATTYGYNNTNNRLGENPSADFPTCYVTALNIGQAKTCSNAGKTVTITRGANTGGWNPTRTCTATIDGWASGSCSYDSGNDRYTGSWTQA